MSYEFPDGEAVMKRGWWDDQPGICRAAVRHGRRNDARHILFLAGEIALIYGFFAR